MSKVARDISNGAAGSAASAGEACVRVELGRRRVSLSGLSNTDAGHVLDLDCASDDDAEVYIDGRLRARGEVVVVDGSLAVRVREVIPAAATACSPAETR